MPAGSDGRVEERITRSEGTIEFKVRAKSPVKFPLHLRIPGWCRKARVLVNGKPAGVQAKAGTFVVIDRTFADGDRVRLELPMEVRVVKQPPSMSLEKVVLAPVLCRPGGGVAVERGPLVYALQIKEDWQVDPKPDGRSTREFPAYNLYAASPWNYALALEGVKASDAIRVVRRRRPAGRNRFAADGSPIVLQVPARRVKGWEIVEHDRVEGLLWSGTGGIGGVEVIQKGRFRFSPPLPRQQGLAARLDKKIETVTLVPYGCAKLRITVFPLCK